MRNFCMEVESNDFHLQYLKFSMKCHQEKKDKCHPLQMGKEPWEEAAKVSKFFSGLLLIRLTGFVDCLI